MEQRKEQLQQAAPGNNLDDMAAAGEAHHVGAMCSALCTVLLCLG
jgi:hypothetical protein